MASTSIQRRRFLKALGTGAAALPFYRLLESSAVQAQTTPPMRLLLIYSAYGGLWDNLRPRGLLGTDAPLTPASISYPGSALAPLAAFTSQMLIVEGIAMSSGLISNNASDPIGSRSLYIGHEHTATNAWTGAPIIDSSSDALPTSGSLEYVLGQKLGADTAVRSLQIGMGGLVGYDFHSSLAFNETGHRLPGFTKPKDAFHQLFGTIVSPPDPQIQVREKSVLAAVQTSAKRLQSRLAGPERVKLDEHLSALADLEARLSSGPATVLCSAPNAPTSDGSDLAASTKDHLAIIREAFACDRTRFITAGWNIAGGVIPNLPYVGHVGDLHGDVAHQIDAAGTVGEAARANMSMLQGWYAQNIADLASRLASTPEGNGTLLDNTLIVWAQDFGENVHGGLNVPYVLLGGAQRKLRMGRYLNLRSNPGALPGSNQSGAAWKKFAPSNQLLVSIANAFGVSLNTFGSSEFVGPLPGLV
jgi:hypothetical protein